MSRYYNDFNHLKHKKVQWRVNKNHFQKEIWKILRKYKLKITILTIKALYYIIKLMEKTEQ